MLMDFSCIYCNYLCMTIRKRNIFLITSNFILFIILIMTASIPFIMDAKNDIPYSVIFYSPDFTMPLILLTFSIISIYLIKYYFLKTNSSEIFFFTLFLISTAFDTSRSIIAALSYLQSPEYYNLLISRICYFGKIFGLLSLFLSALFSSDVETKKIGTSTAIIILISYTLSSSIPFSTYKLSTMIQQPGFLNYFIFSVISIEILTIMIFVLNYLQSGKREYLILSISTFMILTGREITFFSTDPVVFLSGLSILTAGTILFTNKIHHIYAWY